MGRRRWPEQVVMEIRIKCPCGNESTYDPMRQYDPEGIQLMAQIEGGCETCESATWVMACGKCGAEMRP